MTGYLKQKSLNVKVPLLLLQKSNATCFKQDLSSFLRQSFMTHRKISQSDSSDHLSNILDMGCFSEMVSQVTLDSPLAEELKGLVFLLVLTC